MYTLSLSHLSPLLCTEILSPVLRLGGSSTHLSSFHFSASLLGHSPVLTFLESDEVLKAAAEHVGRQHAVRIPLVGLISGKVSLLLLLHRGMVDIFVPLSKEQTTSQNSVSNATTLLYHATHSQNEDGSTQQLWLEGFPNGQSSLGFHPGNLHC